MYYNAWAEIDLDALNFNINQISKLVPTEKIMAVVKANAYGHGAGPISEELIKRGITNFAVSNAYEALDLAERVDVCNILVFGRVNKNLVLDLANKNISVAIFDLDYAKTINEAAKACGVTLKCHIKLDTGMGRLGFNCRYGFNKQTFKTNIEELFKLQALKIVGGFTHFAMADEENLSGTRYTKKQYESFLSAKEIINSVAQNFSSDKLCFHCSNSAATLLNGENFSSDLFRIGLSLYGLSTLHNTKITLKPIMTLKTTIAQIKILNKGEAASYGLTFKAKKPIKIATVTIGYADGYMRGLSNKGVMLVNGKKAKIIGRVCMDQTIIDITDIKNVSCGDEVILFGPNLPAENLAECLNTINYEIVSTVAHRIPRIYFKNNKQTEITRYISL